MFVFEEAEEKAGHELTILNNGAGTSTYFCENCGSIFILYQSDLKIFHAPRGSFSTVGKCMKSGNATGVQDKRTLKVKLRELQDEHFERMKEI